MKTIIALLFALLFVLPAMADTDEDANTPVTVPKKYVTPEGLNHQVSDKVSEWAGIGKEIGVATNDALSSVVGQADRFGNTKVGNFIMFMVAWKLMARDVLGVVLGIPTLVIGMAFWYFVMKRIFFGYRVVSKIEGKTKFYVQQPAYSFESSDARGLAGAASVIVPVAFIIAMLIVIF